MKIDGFLEVPDIPGPSARDGHEEQIEVHGVRFQMEGPYDPNSMARRGRVAMGVITFTKYYDKSSPYLKRALFDNKVLDPVKFYARRTIEGETSDYLEVELTKAVVVRYEMAQSGDLPDLIEENVGFAYQKIKFVYDADHEQEMDVQVGV